MSDADPQPPAPGAEPGESIPPPSGRPVPGAPRTATDALRPAAGAPRPRRRRLALAVIAGGLLALAAGAVVFLLVRSPHDVSHPNLSFTAPTVTTAPKPTPVPVDRFSWPLYGYDLARTRQFTGQPNLHPPFRRGWSVYLHALVEFPPVISGHRLFFMDDSATVRALDAQTGRTVWTHRVGTLSAASPGLDVARHLLIVPVLSDHGRSPGGGQVVALSMLTGRVLWHRALPAGSESSPLIFGHTVFLGDQAGTVYSLDDRTGHVNWTFGASGAVKGGAAMSGTDLYVDDYGGHLYDIDARDGHRRWVASADGGALGLSAGTFYSTPTVAFGRVYVGNTSGYVYSFAAHSGQLAWSYDTGAYVYSSAAVAVVPGLGPTVFMGSYNGNFYAFDARSGRVRWVHHDAKSNRISGSATVVDGLVYYSDLDDKLSSGLDLRTGHQVWSFSDGAFSPVVADPANLFVSGGYALYEIVPRDPYHAATARRTVARRRHVPRRVGPVSRRG